MCHLSPLHLAISSDGKRAEVDYTITYIEGTPMLGCFLCTTKPWFRDNMLLLRSWIFSCAPPVYMTAMVHARLSEMARQQNYTPLNTADSE